MTTHVVCAGIGRMTVAASLALLFFTDAAAAAGGPAQQLRIESDAGGDVGLVARGAPLVDVLRRLSAEGGFEVVIDDAIKRPPVTLNVPLAPVEEVLRDLLHDRNYALVYDDRDEVTQVIVLEPSVPGKPRPVPRTQRSKQRGKQPAQAMVVRQ